MNKWHPITDEPTDQYEKLVMVRLYINDKKVTYITSGYFNGRIGFVSKRGTIGAGAIGWRDMPKASDSIAEKLIAKTQENKEPIT